MELLDNQQNAQRYSSEWSSGEYFKAIQKKNLNGQVINVNFKDLKNGVYKPIFLWVKQARGMMARYVIENRITKVEDLQGFDAKGYYFSAKDSTESELVFLRDVQPAPGA